MIELRDVWFRYEGSDSPALRGVSLEIGRGEIILLLGASGAGKSTLLRTLNGLIPHFYAGEMRGRVVVDGLDTREAPVSELARRVGLVFQNPENQLVTNLVEREIAFGLENLGLSREEMRERVRSVAEELGIERLLKRPTGSLSGGEKQLVAIASVLAMGPGYVALDEPTSELDPRSAEAVADALKRIHGDGRTVIVSEHRLDVFAPLATRAVVIDEGRVLADGDPAEVLVRRDVIESGVLPPRVVQIYLVARDRGLIEGWMGRAPLSVEECLE
ncbi:MAG TPA: ABC transporter ATP-binding protein, partial [Candidatus Korarchaeota archaeon]|nr:ABC transporter ATP-binding protein [Candidatus Korarchaeota archaeon]